MEKIRLDKWLWAARFFKTRSLASSAVKGGKITVNGQRAKAGKDVATGMILKIGQGVFSTEITIQALSERRGPATIAKTLYEETEQSKLNKVQTRENIKLQKIAMPQHCRKPDKHDRKKIIQFRQKNIND